MAKRAQEIGRFFLGIPMTTLLLANLLIQTPLQFFPLLFFFVISTGQTVTSRKCHVLDCCLMRLPQMCFTVHCVVDYGSEIQQVKEVVFLFIISLSNACQTCYLPLEVMSSFYLCTELTLIHFYFYFIFNFSIIHFQYGIICKFL